MKHNFTNVGKFEFKILNFAILLKYNKSSLIVKIVILCILETNIDLNVIIPILETNIDFDVILPILVTNIDLNVIIPILETNIDLNVIIPMSFVHGQNGPGERIKFNLILEQDLVCGEKRIKFSSLIPWMNPLTRSYLNKKYKS